MTITVLIIEISKDGHQERMLEQKFDTEREAQLFVDTYNFFDDSEEEPDWYTQAVLVDMLSTK